MKQPSISSSSETNDETGARHVITSTARLCSLRWPARTGPRHSTLGEKNDAGTPSDGGLLARNLGGGLGHAADVIPTTQASTVTVVTLDDALELDYARKEDLPLAYAARLFNGQAILESIKFLKDYPKCNSVQRTTQILKYFMERGELEYVRTYSRPSLNAWQTRLSFTMGQIRVESIGAGTTTLDADYAAGLYILSTLFKRGHLHHLVCEPRQSLRATAFNEIDGDAIVPDPDRPDVDKSLTKHDLYEDIYRPLARAGLMPKVDVFTVLDKSTNKYEFCQCLEVSEYQFSSTVRHPLAPQLQNFAALNFKKELQPRIGIDQIDQQSDPSIFSNMNLLQDPKAWLCDYQSLNPSAILSLVASRPGGIFKGQINLNGQTFGNAAFDYHFPKMERMASLNAAVALLRASPDINVVLPPLSSERPASTSPDPGSRTIVAEGARDGNQITTTLAIYSPSPLGAPVLNPPETEDQHTTENFDANDQKAMRVPLTLGSGDETIHDLLKDALKAAKTGRIAIPRHLIMPSATLPSRRTKNPQRATPSQDFLSQRSQQLLKLQLKYAARRDRPILRSTMDLPIRQKSSEVLELVNSNIYSIIVGATGCGKSTQVPQIIFEHAVRSQQGGYCNIVCTQPRRIAAKSVAARVARERAERLQEQVGYRVRFDSKPPNDCGGISFETTGTVLESLKMHSDLFLSRVSHLIIDEVHERDINIDCLLTAVREAINNRLSKGLPVPKVTLMSATVDPTIFSNYLADHRVSPPKHAPVLSIPGRTFPVKDHFLEDIIDSISSAGGGINRLVRDRLSHRFLKAEEHISGLTLRDRNSKNGQDNKEEPIVHWSEEGVELKWSNPMEGETEYTNEKIDDIGDNFSDLADESGMDEAKLVCEPIPPDLVAAAIAAICRTTLNGAILVFLPGITQLQQVQKVIQEGRNPFCAGLQDASKYAIFLLHSTLRDTQSQVFDPTPEGCRKIILATNIAETSITIPDVEYVLDSGQSRQHIYDPLTRSNQLKTDWISKQSSKQRAGRAGRVRSGNYYALFTKARHVALAAANVPEIMQSDLQQICLDVKARGYEGSMHDYLTSLIAPPSALPVTVAIVDLIELGVLAESEAPTPLGRLLSILPVHPRNAKLILLGIVYRCLDPMILLSVLFEGDGLFSSSLKHIKNILAIKSAFSGNSKSDAIADLNAFYYLRYLRDTTSDSILADFSRWNYLKIHAFNAIENIASQIKDILERSGWIAPQEGTESQSQYDNAFVNENSDNDELIKALLVSCMFPNLAVHDTQTGKVRFAISNGRYADLSPTSINNIYKPPSPNLEKSQLPARIVTFSDLLHYGPDDRRIYCMRDTTEVTPLTAALFGGKLSYERETTTVNVNNKKSVSEAAIMRVEGGVFAISCTNLQAKMITELRDKLKNVETMTFDRILRGARSTVFMAKDQTPYLFTRSVSRLLALANAKPTSTDDDQSKSGAPGPDASRIERVRYIVENNYKITRVVGSTSKPVSKETKAKKFDSTTQEKIDGLARELELRQSLVKLLEGATSEPPPPPSIQGQRYMHHIV